MRLKAMLVCCVMAGIAITVRADDWPQFLGPKRDGVWRETGIVDTLPKEPKVLWRKPVAQGYAGPAVANGFVFVTDFVPAGGAVLPKNGFGKGAIPGKERVLCLNEKTGEQVWSQEYEVTYRVSYPGGTRCAPTVDGESVYTLGTMSDLLCLDAKTGKIRWQKNFVKDYDAIIPIWGFASAPLVDGDNLICFVGGSEGRSVIAFDKKTGKENWKAVNLSGEIGYAVPVIYTVGTTRQLILWHPKAVVALDPATGKQLWSQAWSINASLTVPMPRLVDDDKLFLTSFYNGSQYFKLDKDKPGASVIWKSKSKGNQDSVMPEKTVDLHSIMPTPIIKDGYIYGVCSYGELRCLKLDTGERVWATHEPITGKSTRWGNAFIIPQGDRYFLFNEGGELITCKLSPEKYEETSRLKLLEPTNVMAGRPVVWMHPAFANKNFYGRNDKEIICVSLAK